MLDDFFDKKCSIFSSENAIIDWSQVKQLVEIYSNIDCDFYKKYWVWLLIDKNQKEQDSNSYIIVCEWAIANIKQTDIIELKDPLWWIVWRYNIEAILYHRDLNWIIDNTTIKAKA